MSDIENLNNSTNKLFVGIEKLINNAGQQVAVYLNSSLAHLYWSIGNCILTKMKYEVYSDNGKQIVATLSQQLNKKGVNQ